MSKLIVKSILAACAISIGCIVNLSVENPVLGAFLFSFGLLSVCFFKLNLFTGKICFLEDYSDMFIILLFNILVAFAFGLITQDFFQKEKIEATMNFKMNESTFEIFLRSILCNVMIFIACFCYRIGDGDFEKYGMIIFSIMIFILSKFEHCVANAFYFGVYFTNIHFMDTCRFMFINILGNFIAGRLCYILFIK